MEKNRKYVFILTLFLCISMFLSVGQNFNSEIKRDNNRTPKTPLNQTYNTNSTSNDINAASILIHQAYHSEDIVEVNSTHNNLTIPAPNDSNFNTSYSNVNFTNLNAYNYTMDVETSTPTNTLVIDTLNSLLVGFTVSTDCYLKNATINVDVTGSITYYAYLIPSTWDGVKSYPGLDANQVFSGTPLTPTGTTSSANGWVSLNFPSAIYLDTSTTDNNTWFISLITGSPGKNWNTVIDDDGTLGDGVNETEVYRSNFAGNTYSYYQQDALLKVDLSLNNPNPKPSEISLKINDLTVVDDLIIDNKGGWDSSNVYAGNMGYLNFTFDSIWYNYSLDVNLVQTNFTKTDFTSYQAFTVNNTEGPGWVVQLTINEFDGRLDNNTINITIPSNWNPAALYYGDSPPIPQTFSTNQIGDFTIVRTYGLGVGNGIWTLLSTSDNLLVDLEIGKDGIGINKAYSNETIEFNATFSKPIIGEVNLTIYNPKDINGEENYSRLVNVPTYTTNVDLGEWDIQTNISRSGYYRIRATWNNDTEAAFIEKTILVAWETEVQIINLQNYETFNDVGGIFNISLTYINKTDGLNITGATVGSNATGSWYSETQNYDIDSPYNITFNPIGFNTGNYKIEITINKTECMNYTVYYNLRVVNNTQVTPYPLQNELNVIRGFNVTYNFKYEQVEPSNPDIEQGLITTLYLEPELTVSFNNLGSGDYRININTSQIDVGSYSCQFTITNDSMKTVEFQFIITVTKPETELILDSLTNEVWRKSGLNITAEFKINDTDNEELLTNVNLNSFEIYNGSNPNSLWNVGDWNFNFWEMGSGVYGTNISIKGLDYGTYSFIINATYDPNYQTSLMEFQVYIRGNYTEINLIDINNNNGQALPQQAGDYQFYKNNQQIGLKFTVVDLEWNDNLITESSTSDKFHYWVILNDTISLTSNLAYDKNIDQITGNIIIPLNINLGDNQVKLIVGKKNYENATYTINLNILPEKEIKIELISDISNITQTQSITIKFKITYLEGGNWLPLQGETIGFSTNISSEVTSTSNNTDSEGIVVFTFTIPRVDFKGIIITLTYNGQLYSIDSGSNSFTFDIIPPPNTGIPPEVLYAIIIAIIGTVSVIGVKKGIIDPRKRRREELLINTASQFEDAINLQHILIIYKQTGTCLYFKSFGLEQIDPDLISGFLSAAQSFVKESMASDGLSEMKSGENHLLTSDGELIRITLVLSKSASNFLRNNLTRLVFEFESQYRDKLVNWKGQLNIFQDAGELIDEYLNTSIILPHEINGDIKVLKSVSGATAKSLLGIARELTTGQRKFFFIAQLVSEAKEKLKKDPPEILLALNELLDADVFLPIDLSKLETKPISEEELKVLAERVASLPNLTNEEKENLIKDLVDLNAAEREAALTSLQQGRQIVSDVSKKMISTKRLPDVKAAKAEIKSLLKQGKKLIKEKEYEDAVLCYETAEVTANKWGLTKEAKEYRDMALNAQIEEFNYKIDNAKKQVPKLIKQEKLEEAAELGCEGQQAADSLFKLGFSKYNKDVKYFAKLVASCSEDGKLRKQMKEPEKDKSELLKEQKKLSKQASKLEKKKAYYEAIDVYTDLTIIADKLFKFGVMSASDDMKRYKVKIAELRRKEEKEEVKKQPELSEEQLNDQKSQLLNIALEAEQEGNFPKALVAYQQVQNVYHNLGDSENASRINDKIQEIVGKIPNMEELIKSLFSNAESALDEDNPQVAFAQYQYARGLCQAIGDSKRLKMIEKKLNEISKYL